MLNVEHRRLPAALVFPDPLDDDLADDDRIVLTRRRLVRLALVACETGARFERDGVRHDPMAWMLAPRRLFDGRTAIEACLELEGCNRAIVLHGLALGLDADADEIDELLADEPGDIDEDVDALSLGRTAEAAEDGVDVDDRVAAADCGRAPILGQDGRALVKCRAA
ncbi:hypothetical protein [Sphingomonas aerolata]|uniref:hypothetical protein n=1 Tax=Sphingomonas aerolata TaxID=185951 RepID=UPI002FDF2349